jgi:AbrB family looped-hinge helix DNA binding protein
MKITAKGQVTVPQHIRQRLGLLSNTEVEWELRDGEAVLRKARDGTELRGRALVDHMRGRGSVPMSTDEIMDVTRGEPRRRRGSLEGQVFVPDSFFDPLPDGDLNAWDQ